MSEVSPEGSTKRGVGRVVQVIGPTIDAVFEPGHLPGDLQRALPVVARR